MENQVLDVIRNRRSVRAYRPEKLPRETLEAILEAGRYAPSGGNNQTSHFLVLESPAVLEELAHLVEREFCKMELREDLYSSLKSSIVQSKRGGYVFHYGAPALVVLANRKGYGNAMADCSVALENMMLAAASLGVGSCWINQLHWLDENPAVRQYLEALGLEENETVCGAVSLGMPGEDIRPPLPRKGNRVTFVGE